MKPISLCLCLVLCLLAVFPRFGSAQQAPVGYYSADGNEPSVPAPPGYYTDSPGSTSVTAAAAGSFVDTYGASGSQSASAGEYAPIASMREAISTPAGYYTDTSGSTGLTAAGVGTYVDTYGATSAQSANVGRYAPVAGMQSDIAAPAGYFVSGPGSSAPQAAPAGTYVGISGASGATDAQPGYYAPVGGLQSQIPAPAGYYTPTPASTALFAAPAGSYAPGGGTSAVPADPGFFVPTARQSVQTPCPPGTTSYVGSTAARISSSNVTRGLYVVGPLYGSRVAPAGRIIGTNTTGTVSLGLVVSNSAHDFGQSNILTDLSVLDARFNTGDSGSFAFDGFAPFVLSEGQTGTIHLTATAPVTQSVQTVLNVITDEDAGHSETGNVYTYEVFALQSSNDTDADGDGLTTTEEILLGTEPDDDDTDGDGFLDGEESSNDYLDPLVNDSNLVDFVQSERQVFDLYSLDDLIDTYTEAVLIASTNDQFLVEWVLETSTNFVDFNELLTNSAVYTPETGATFRILRLRSGPP